MGVVRGINVIVLPENPEAKSLALEVAPGLYHRHNPDPVSLGQNPFRGEADGMGINQLLRGPVNCVVRETNHRTHLCMVCEVCIKGYSQSKQVT